MISGTISLPSPGYFSTFIHITCALSVVSEYLALGRGRPGFSRDFSCPVILGILLGYFRISPTRLSLPLAWLSSQFGYPSIIPYRSPATPRTKNAQGLGCFLFARRYWGNNIHFLFLRVLRWFSSPGIAFPCLFDSAEKYSDITRNRFPDSEISGSKPACDSPKHIAACHVLHRLLTPSHPS